MPALIFYTKARLSGSLSREKLLKLFLSFVEGSLKELNFLPSFTWKPIFKKYCGPGENRRVFFIKKKEIKILVQGFCLHQHRAIFGP